MPAHKLLLCASALAVGGAAELVKTGEDVGKVPGDVSWSWMGDLAPNNAVTSGSVFELKWAKLSGPVGYHSWKLVAWSDEIQLISEGVPYWAGTAAPAEVSDLWHNGAVVGKAGSQQGSVKQTVTCPQADDCKVKYQIVLLGVSAPNNIGIGTVDETQYNVSPVLEVTVEGDSSFAAVPTTTPTTSSTTTAVTGGAPGAPTFAPAPAPGPAPPFQGAPSTVAPPAPSLKYVDGSWRGHFSPGETIALGAEKWYGAPYPATWKILMAMGPRPADPDAADPDDRRRRRLEAGDDSADAVVFLEDAVVPVPSDLVCQGTFSDSERVLEHMLASCQTQLPAEEGIFYYQAFFCVPKAGGGNLCSNSPVSSLVVSVEALKNVSQVPAIPKRNVFPPSVQLSSEEYMAIELEKKSDELKAALAHLVTRAADQMEFMSKDNLLKLEHTDKNHTPLPRHPTLSMFKNNVAFVDAIFQDAAAANGVGSTGEDMWAYLFPLRAVTPEGARTKHDGIYSYLNFLRAVALYPKFCFEKADWVEESMEEVCRRELASMFSHFTQEVGAHAAEIFVFTLPDGSSTTADEWRQGLFHVEEMGCGSQHGCPGYSSMCDPAMWQGQAWPCPEGGQYFGRGAKQLSYNYNYGVLSAVVFGDVSVVLNDPAMISRTWLALVSAVYFSMQPRPPKPSIHEMVTGFWRPGQFDVDQLRTRGFGVSTLIVNGGIECGGSSEHAASANRMKYYEGHATAFGIWDLVEDERNGCAGMSEFDATSSGSYLSYWDPHYEGATCYAVAWETAYSAYIEGDYESCVLNMHFDGAEAYPAPRTPEEQAALEAQEAAKAAAGIDDDADSRLSPLLLRAPPAGSDL